MSNAEIAERYAAGVSLTELALRTRTSHYVIRDIVQMQGVRLRSPREAMMLAQEDRRQRRARLARRRDAG